MSTSLTSDCAALLTRAIVGRFNWDHESQMVEAYRELLPAVRDGLEEYRRKLAHRARRLRPLEHNEPKEITDAP